MPVGMLQPGRTGDREAGLAIRAQFPPSSEAPKTISRHLPMRSSFLIPVSVRVHSSNSTNPDVNQCRKLFSLIPLWSFISPAFVHRTPSEAQNDSPKQALASSHRHRQQKRRLPGIFQVGGASFRTVGHQAQTVRDGTRASRCIGRNNAAVSSIRIAAAPP